MFSFALKRETVNKVSMEGRKKERKRNQLYTMRKKRNDSKYSEINCGT
jgi:hypothetical protein